MKKVMEAAVLTRNTTLKDCRSSFSSGEDPGRSAVVDSPEVSNESVFSDRAARVAPLFEQVASILMQTMTSR